MKIKEWNVITKIEHGFAETVCSQNGSVMTATERFEVDTIMIKKISSSLKGEFGHSLAVQDNWIKNVR